MTAAERERIEKDLRLLKDALAEIERGRVAAALLESACQEKDAALVEIARWLMDVLADNRPADTMNRAAAMLARAHDALGSPTCEACRLPMLPDTYHTDSDGVTWHQEGEWCPAEGV